jgi:hypothetical protein
MNWDLWGTLVILVACCWWLIKNPGTNTWGDDPNYD